MSDHPTPAPRAPEAERPEGTGTNIYLQQIEYLTARARAAEEELERVRDLTRAAMAYGDAGTTQRINALHRAAKAYYARRAGSQGEERA